MIVDAVARRRVGLPFWITGSILKQAPATFVLMVPIALVSYVATWTGWIFTKGGYDRSLGRPRSASRGAGAFAWVPHWVQNLWHYQTEMYNYSINLHVPHPYQANPLTWLFMIRPTSMYYEGTVYGQNGCTSSACSSAITSVGNPLIWWAAAAAVFYLVYRLVRYREWRVGLILTGRRRRLPAVAALHQPHGVPVLYDRVRALPDPGADVRHRAHSRQAIGCGVAAQTRHPDGRGLPRDHGGGQRLLLLDLDRAAGSVLVLAAPHLAAELAVARVLAVGAWW